MSNSMRFQAASDLLFDHWSKGRRLDTLPDDLRPASRQEGYAIQSCLEARSGQPLFGWKIAATSAAGQAHIGVDGPLAGRLLAERVLPDGATATFGSNLMCVAEVEFAFRMGRDLAPRDRPRTVGEVLDAVKSLHPAIEVPDSRYHAFVTAGAPQLIADNACAHEFVLGPAAPAKWRGIDLVQHRAVGTVVAKLEREGVGANVLGDPRVALTWLANELSDLGVTLKAGQVVTTGTCLAPLPIEAGDTVQAHFGELGRVSVRFV